MTPDGSARAAGRTVRDSERISAQIRRFALLWMAASLGVLVFVAAASVLASNYRDDAGRRARATAGAQLAAAQLQADVQRQAADVLGYGVTGQATYRQQFARDSAAARSSMAALRTAAGEAGPHPSDRRLLAGTLTAITAWQQRAALEVARRHGGHGGLSPAGNPAPDGRISDISGRLQLLAGALTGESQSAIVRARSHAHVADLLRQVATLIGLVIMFAGGARLLRRAFRLAGEADARRERETHWNSQIEAVMAWSVRAKSAVTRSQLIGYANMVPREAVGATCFVISEGAQPAHRSHGQPRLVTTVDEAGEGLHVSVCFADGRGDEHDHHALDLLLGHLAALWRTVLRQEDLERAAGHDALTGLPNRRAFEAELRRRVALSRRRDLGFTLAMVDLDHFKLVNDSFGHPEGDAVLRRSGEAIRAALRASDRVFRVGGEEFALILETAEPAGIDELLERSRAAVKALAVEPVSGRRLSASIGWAVIPHDADERAGLVAAADAALYRAKEGGRDRVLRAGDADLLAS